MKENRRPTSTWVLYRLGTPRNGSVTTEAGDKIRVGFWDHDATYGDITMSRKEARLLAKRINECLDATVKK